MASPVPERKRGRSPSPSRHSDSRRRTRSPDDRDERERLRKREKERRRVERRRREREEEEEERSKPSARAFSPPRRPASSASLRSTPPHLRTIDRSVAPLAPAASSSSSASTSQAQTRAIPTGPSKPKEEWDRLDWEQYREGLTSSSKHRSPPPLPFHSSSGLELCRNMVANGFCPFGTECRFHHPPPPSLSSTSSVKSVAEPTGRIAVVDAPKAGPCRNWEMTGSCVFGQDCRFTHGSHERERVVDVTPDRRQLCKDYLTKGCRRENCRFKHSADGDPFARRGGGEGEREREKEPSNSRDEFASFWESGPSNLVETGDVKMEDTHVDLDHSNGRQLGGSRDDEYSPLAPHASHVEAPLAASSGPPFVPQALSKVPSLQELEEINRAVLAAAPPPPSAPPASAASAARAPGPLSAVPSLSKEKILKVLVQIQKLYQQGKTPETCTVMGHLLDLVRVFEDENGPVEQHIDPASILSNAATPTPAPAAPVPSSGRPSALTAPPPMQAPRAPSAQPSTQPKNPRAETQAGPPVHARRDTISSIGGSSVNGKSETRRSATPSRLVSVKTESDVVEMEPPRRKSLSRIAPPTTPTMAFSEILEIFTLLTKHQNLSSTLSTEQVTLDKLRTSTSSGKDLYVQHTEKRLAKLKDEIEYLPAEITSRLEKMKARGTSDAGLEGILSHVEELLKGREDAEKETMTMRIRLEMMEEEVSKIAAVSESNKVELEKLKIDLAEEREQKERLERENRDLKASNGGPSPDSSPGTPASDVMAGPDDDVAGSSQEAPSLAGLKQAMEEVAMQKDELLEFKKGILSVLSQLKPSDFTDSPTNAESPTNSSSNNATQSLFRGLFPSWQ